MKRVSPPGGEEPGRDDFSRGDLRQAARKGIPWIVWSRVLLQVLSVGTTIVLAHLLTPTDFGLFGLAFVLVQLVNYVDGFRVEAALVQAKTPDEKTLSTTFYFSSAVSLFFLVVAWLAGPLLSDLFRTEELGAVLRVAALVFVVRGIAAVHRALLNRALRFKALSVIELATVVVGGVVAIAMALLGYGVWSLVWYYVVREAVAAAAAIVLTRWRPKTRPSRRSLAPLLLFGGPSAASELLLYLHFYMADVVVGRVLGAKSLGLFQQGQALATRPSSMVRDVVGKVAFPIFSRAQSRPEQVRAGYLLAISSTATLLIPVTVLVLLFAPELVQLLYGSQWTEAVPVVQWLAPMAAFRVLQPLTSGVLHSAAKTNLEMRINLATAVVFAVLLALTMRYGLVGVCVATLLTFAFHAGMSQHAINGILGLSWREFFGKLWVPSVGTIALVNVYLAAERWPAFVPSSNVGRLLVVGAGCGFAYLAVVAWLDRTVMETGLSWIGIRRKESG